MSDADLRDRVAQVSSPASLAPESDVPQAPPSDGVSGVTSAAESAEPLVLPVSPIAFPPSIAQRTQLPPPGADAAERLQDETPATSLAGAVTPLSEARGATVDRGQLPAPETATPIVLPAGDPPARPSAPLESAVGRSAQAVEPVAVVDNAAVIDTALIDSTLRAGVLVPAEHPAVHAARRRRRSASPLPPLPSPADIPEDAPGRVALFTLAAAPDIAPSPVRPIDPPTAPALEGSSVAAEPLDEWLPVAVLSILMLVVFIVGVAVTRG